MPRCKNCKDKFEAKYFLQKFCLDKDECIKAFAKYAKDKEEKSKPKSKRVLRPDLYIRENKEDLQDAINKIARLIDKGTGCIDCGNKSSKIWDGGHFRSRGAHPALRYNLHNIFNQSRACNSFKEKDKTEYINGIISTYGEEYYKKVDSLYHDYPKLGLRPDDYPAIVKEARKIVRELEKLDMKYTAEHRIALRESYNKRLGIYK